MLRTRELWRTGSMNCLAWKRVPSFKIQTKRIWRKLIASWSWFCANLQKTTKKKSPSSRRRRRMTSFLRHLLWRRWFSSSPTPSMNLAKNFGKNLSMWCLNGFRMRKWWCGWFACCIVGFCREMSMFRRRWSRCSLTGQQSNMLWDLSVFNLIWKILRHYAAVDLRMINSL